MATDDRPETASEPPMRSHPSRSTTLLFRLILVSLIAVSVYAVFLMNQQRIRTRQAMVRVQVIQDAIERWQSQAEASKPVPEGADPPMPESSAELASVSPEAAKWLSEGDEYYVYKFSGLRYEGETRYPLIAAEARDPAAVFGEAVVSTPGGMATVGRVSPAGRRFSLPDFIREHPVTVTVFFMLVAAGLWVNLGKRR